MAGDVPPISGKKGITKLMTWTRRLIGRVETAPTRAAKFFFRQTVKDINRAFQTSSTPQGTPWAPPKQPLKPRGRKLLVKTGEMRESALAAAAAPDLFVSPSGSVTGHAVLRTPRYAGFHTQGTANMAARQFFGYSQETVDATRDFLMADAVPSGGGTSFSASASNLDSAAFEIARGSMG